MQQFTARPIHFISLRIKLLLGFTVVYSVISVATYGWFYRYSTDKAMQRIQQDLVETLMGAVKGIDVEEFQTLAQVKVPEGQILPLGNPLYQKHQEWLNLVHQIEPRANPYTFVVGSKPYEVLFIGDYLRITHPDSSTSFRESYIAVPAKTRLYQGLTRLTITLTPYRDKWGYWVSAYGPIKTVQGKVVGGIGVDFRADHVIEVERGIQRNLTIAFTITYLSLFILVYLISDILTNPIAKLAKVTEQIGAGKYHQTLSDLRGRKIPDEISTLAAMFEQMVDKVRQREEMLQEYSQSLEEKVEQRTEELQSKNSQLKQTLLHLQQTQTQLVHSEKMSSLGQLVAGIAHEINNPANFIHGNLTHLQNYVQDLLLLIQLYQQYYPDSVPEIQAEAQRVDLEFMQADLPKMLSSIRSGTERIRQIVLSLRNFSRMDEAEFKSVNIHEGIDSTLLILHHRLVGRAERPEIKVVKDYGDLPLVECYPGQLNQVFMNILTNAIDAVEESTPTNHKQITIRTSVIDRQWVQIAIADNGVGIPPEIQPYIFNPFFTTKPIGKGTGMGMSISYQIVTKKHGGKLEFFSTLGKGSEFLIQIPIRQEVSKDK
ncbi:ATP-binding protein [Floridanema evergladense]|uniref:histidine kinase n=1 Tax=Floridaenema evergladense BLCC-F167 TaxID=3153639 RepID=A0ABV4WEX4_9CYAN